MPQTPFYGTSIVPKEKTPARGCSLCRGLVLVAVRGTGKPLNSDISIEPVSGDCKPSGATQWASHAVRQPTPSRDDAQPLRVDLHHSPKSGLCLRRARCVASRDATCASAMGSSVDPFRFHRRA
jgi:hypothetical protein